MNGLPADIAAGRRLLNEARYRDALHHLRSCANDSAEAAMLCGVAASRLDDPNEAIGHFTRASELSPELVAAHLNLGLVLRAIGRDREAEMALDAALALDGSSLPALLAAANLRMKRGATEAAAGLYERVLASEPHNAVALNNLGLCHRLQGQDDRAAACFAELVARRPEDPVALANLGVVRASQGRSEEAVSLYRRALAASPDHLEAANNLGVSLLDQGRAREAADVLRPIVESGRAAAETFANLGNALAKLGDVDGAAAAYDGALSQQASDGVRIRRALLLPVIAESRAAMEATYRHFTEAIDELRAMPLNLSDPYSEVGTTVFNISYHDACNRAAMRDLAELFRSACPELAFIAPHCARKRSTNGRVRVGFISRHLQANSVGRCFHGIIRFPQRNDVEVVAFTFGRTEDPLWQLIAGGVDRAVVLPNSLGLAREAIAAQELDALIYTDLGMEPLTYFLSFARLAPVQCVLGGHPDAVGVPSLDHYLSCDAQEPADADDHYDIPLVRLPGAPTYYERPDLPDPLKPRSTFGLPESGALYFCAQTLIKIHPDMDALFGAILERDPFGTLVLPEGYTSELATRLRMRFERTLGSAVDRVIFLPAMSHMDFMNVMALADVSLDTRPFGGGNTSWQAIAAGTPMVSWPGQYLRGRYTRALYTLIGVEDATARTAAEYVDLAVRFGTDAQFRKQFNERVDARCDRIFADRKHVDALYEFLVSRVRC